MNLYKCFSARVTQAKLTHKSSNQGQNGSRVASPQRMSIRKVLLSARKRKLTILSFHSNAKRQSDSFINPQIRIYRNVRYIYFRNKDEQLARLIKKQKSKLKGNIVNRSGSKIHDLNKCSPFVASRNGRFVRFTIVL